MPTYTLGYLHDQLDWSKADDAMRALDEEHGYLERDPQFVRNWRCVLLEQAFYGDEPRQTAARQLLAQVGMWVPAVEQMQNLGLA